VRITKRMRLIARVLGYRCCLTCKFFNPKVKQCEHPEISKEPYFPSYFFDLRHWREDKGLPLLERVKDIGSECTRWKGFKEEDLRRRK